MMILVLLVGLANLAVVTTSASALLKHVAALRAEQAAMRAAFEADAAARRQRVEALLTARGEGRALLRQRLAKRTRPA